MKYAWIEQNKLRWPFCLQCRVLSVSASGYRQHRARKQKILTRRHLSETALLVEIRALRSVVQPQPVIGLFILVPVEMLVFDQI